MRMGLREVFQFFLLGFFLVSCNETVIKNAGSGNNVNPAGCGDTPISFASVNEQIFLKNCISCHASGSPNGISLSTYAEVKANILRIKDSVLANRMPKAGPLSGADKILLVSWISQGAPERAEDADMSCAEHPPEETLLQPTYESLKTKVFSQNCNGCHREGGRLKDFSSYEAITSNANSGMFNQENPDESEFVKRLVTSDVQKVMPPQRTGLPKLSPDVVAVIKEWIARGLPKN